MLAENAKNNGITKLLLAPSSRRTTTRSASQIADQIETVEAASERSSGNHESFSIAVDVMRPDLALGLNLLADVIGKSLLSRR